MAVKQFETKYSKEELKKLKQKARRLGSRLAQRRGKKVSAEEWYEKQMKLKEKLGLKEGGMVKSYSHGGSVSRGQYASQPKKIKFKGVF